MNEWIWSYYKWLEQVQGRQGKSIPCREGLPGEVLSEVVEPLSLEMANIRSQLTPVIDAVSVQPLWPLHVPYGPIILCSSSEAETWVKYQL